MGWLLVRAAAAALVLGAGLAVGRWAGASAGQAAAGTAAGAAAALLVVLLVDGWRGQRLLGWLRRDDATQPPADAPRLHGLWGEVAGRIERALQLRERRIDDERRRLDEFLHAIDASPNGVVLLDARDAIVWCNRAAREHLGLTLPRDLHQPITNLVRAPAFVARMRAHAAGVPAPADGADALAMASPDGRLALSVQLSRYGRRQTLVITQDVTERQRIEAMRRDFVANVSHEIRTPLTVLAGYVETMASVPLDAGERARILATMQQQSERMRTLVADLLQLAQLEAGAPPPLDRWVDLGALVQRAADDARALSGMGHRIEVAPLPAVAIAGHDGELLSALGNLTANAVRHTPDGGAVAIAWRDRGDGGGAIEVRDRGPGIAREHLPRLAERFYRVDPSRSRATGGTGLGLAIVKHVAQRHGGALEIESVVGAGSTFRLALPASRLRRDAGSAPREASPAADGVAHRGGPDAPAQHPLSAA